MRLLVDKRIKSLFIRILLCILFWAITSVAFTILNVKYAVIYVLICAILSGTAILITLYHYFKEQHKIISEATAQITACISGDQNIRLSCNKEGELYILFHEINALAAILNAHADNEERAKGFLKNTISDISHQLKTPLAALNIYNGLIQEEAADLPAIREFTDLSEQELDRIETLVQNLLKITKLDAGTIIFEKNDENISDMMIGIEKQFAYRAKQEHKTFLLTGDETVTLLCDRSWLTEAISNIVKNAFDHTKNGDTIHVTWQQSASVIQIIVQDSGSGIHPEDLYYIFKRFYRSRFSKDTQGIGLGLPLAKTIVEAHNGTIEVNSEPGHGAAFILNFLIPTKL